LHEHENLNRWLARIEARPQYAGDYLG